MLGQKSVYKDYFKDDKLELSVNVLWVWDLVGGESSPYHAKVFMLGWSIQVYISSSGTLDGLLFFEGFFKFITHFCSSQSKMFCRAGMPKPPWFLYPFNLFHPSTVPILSHTDLKTLSYLFLQWPIFCFVWFSLACWPMYHVKTRLVLMVLLIQIDIFGKNTSETKLCSWHHNISWVT